MIDVEINGRGALISNDQKYRYTLTRKLAGSEPPLVFCMLNPSTADAYEDDPTIRRCVGFANRENASGLIVVNICAYRATDPRELLTLKDPYGPENYNVIRHIAERNKRVVCAWGVHGPRTAAGGLLLMFDSYRVRTMCLGTTKDGSPRHPLYVRADQPLIAYEG